MPDAPTLTTQQLAVLVGSYLSAIEDIAAADRAALEAARWQLTCQRGHDDDATAAMGRAVAARLDRVKLLEEAIQPVRDRWYALYAVLPTEALNQATVISAQSTRARLDLLAVQQEIDRVRHAQTSPLDRPGACLCSPRPPAPAGGCPVLDAPASLPTREEVTPSRTA